MTDYTMRPAARSLAAGIPPERAANRYLMRLDLDAG